MSPWIWAVAALVLGFAELHAPGYYLIWIAGGAAVAAVAGFLFALALEMQIVVFAAASVASCVGGYFVYRGMMGMRSGAASMTLNQRGREIVGAHGVVTQALANGQGKIRLGDSVWLAEGPDLPEGAPVVVTSTRGTIAIVAAL